MIESLAQPNHQWGKYFVEDSQLTEGERRTGITNSSFPTVFHSCSDLELKSWWEFLWTNGVDFLDHCLKVGGQAWQAFSQMEAPLSRKDAANNLNSDLSKLLTTWCRNYWGQTNMLFETTGMLSAKFSVRGFPKSQCAKFSMTNNPISLTNQWNGKERGLFQKKRVWRDIKTQ